MHISATKEPYGYLLVDLKQDTADDARLKTKVIKGGGNCKMLQFTTGSEQINSVKRMLKRNIKWIRAIVHALIVVLFLPLQWTYRNMQKEGGLKMMNPCEKVVLKMLMNLMNLVGIT